jgi:hypothetical protein
MKILANNLLKKYIIKVNLQVQARKLIVLAASEIENILFLQKIASQSNQK